MKALYEVTVKFRVIQDVDTLENIKSNDEYANDLAHMVCDEASMCGAVATYEVIESKMNVN